MSLPVRVTTVFVLNCQRAAQPTRKWHLWDDLAQEHEFLKTGKEYSIVRMLQEKTVSHPGGVLHTAMGRIVNCGQKQNQGRRRPDSQKENWERKPLPLDHSEMGDPFSFFGQQWNYPLLKLGPGPSHDAKINRPLQC